MPWASVFAFLNDETRAHLTERVGRLVGDGVGFVIHVQASTGACYRVSGRTVGLQAELRIDPLSDAEAQLFHRAEQDRHACADAFALLQSLEAAPGLVLRVNAAGEAVWQTQAMAALIDAAVDPAQLLAPVAGPVSVTLRSGDVQDLQVSVSPIEGSTDRLMLFADISEARRARRTLTSFMTTMTETFAHLGTALAVFDDKRALTLFNPQLPDLFDLDPAALAGRPGLKDFLDALRHARKLPEQADYTGWRTSFIAEVTAHRETPVEQLWHLPAGDILRVTARPHAGGTVVLLFEDISDHVSLERRYRIEIENGQSILDQLGEGVAVFAGSGQVVYCNPAFADALGFDPFRDMLSGGLQVLINHAISVFGQSDHWQSFREYALSHERRSDWTRSLATPSGGRLWLRANPLPDGSTMLVVTSAAPDRIAPERAPGVQAGSQRTG